MKRIVLELDLARGVLVAPASGLLGSLVNQNAPSIDALRRGLRAAAADDRVAGLVVHVNTLTPEVTTLQQLGDLVTEFGRHRPTLAWAESFGEMVPALAAVAFASTCDQVWLAPPGAVNMGGVATTIVALRGLIEKLGGDPEIGQRKEYKTAADQLGATEITPANYEMTQRLVDSICEQCVTTISKNRNLGTDVVRDLIERSKLTPQQALEAGLIDHIGYRDQVYAAIEQAWGSDQRSFVHRYGARRGRGEQVRAALTRPAQIGVVDVRGSIVTGRGREGATGKVAAADVIVDQLRSLEQQDQVRAVILRVDSPGGSAIASDLIWRGVGQLRASGRPVVAQMGRAAASGGYYVAMGADEIIALPATLTGSIGVLAGKVVVQRAQEWLGLKVQDVVAGPHAAQFSPNAPFTPEQWRLLDEDLDRIYHDFVAKAAQGRAMTYDELEPLAHGRVWTGADARERGLVDHTGGIDLAIERVCALAGIDQRRAVLHPVRTGWRDLLRPAENTDAVHATVGAAQLGDLASQLGLGTLEGLATLDGFVRQVAPALGLGPMPGALTMPWQIEIR